ncbi:hypothetical protein EJ08DRAFT_662931 [Tothia fuscella]|uniref:Uncharacterized protein n=1 Tax=Tothia fuscella TaxID=1048955 RepID=A0A9P4NM39_9PEZI|nr:hypothetical protein EJ08DRAFT_662931 [Tothia fuscella]
MRCASMISKDRYAAFLAIKPRILASATASDDGSGPEEDTYFSTLPLHGRISTIETWIEVLEESPIQRECGEVYGVRQLEELAIDKFQELGKELGEEEAFSPRQFFNLTGEVYVSPSCTLKYFCEQMVLPAHNRGCQSALTETDITTLRLWDRFERIGKEDPDIAEETFSDLLRFPDMTQTWMGLKDTMKAGLSFQFALHCHAVQYQTISDHFEAGHQTKEVDICNDYIDHRKKKEFFHYLSTESDLLRSVVNTIGEPLTSHLGFMDTLDKYWKGLGEEEIRDKVWHNIEEAVRGVVDDCGIEYQREMWELCEGELDGYQKAEFADRYEYHRGSFLGLDWGSGE